MVSWMGNDWAISQVTPVLILAKVAVTMRIKFLFAVVVVCLALLTGCSGAERAEYAAYGKKHRIDRWSGGQIVKTWTSTGIVHTEKDTDGYYFQDAKTRVLVRVTGELDITPITFAK